MGAGEWEAHVRVHACALARARKGKERRGKERREEEEERKGEHNFVRDGEDDYNDGGVIWRFAFHEFARTRRARSRDRKRALMMARTRRRARVEYNRQLPWLLP